MNLEQDVEPFLETKVSNRYWNEGNDHADFRAIINAIDTGGGQTCDVPKVLAKLYEAGFVIVRMK